MLRIFVGSLLLAVSCLPHFAPAAESTVPVGLARRDVTPRTPLRLTGYAARKTEFEGIDGKLWAKALAIGGDEDGPLLMITVDSIGIPYAYTTEILARINKKTKVQPERFVICASHTHCGPALAIGAKLILQPDYPPDQQEHTAQYTAELLDSLEKVALDALADRRPANLSWAEGSVGFAVNRRVLKDGQWTGFGVQKDRPVDHRLPVLKITDPHGALRGLLAGYACHCTTLSYNRVHGDWAGVAQEELEKAHPGAVAMINIGCAGDANPEPRNQFKYVEEHGHAFAAAVESMLSADWRPLPALTAARTAILSLPFDKIPTREEFEERSKQKGPIAIHARAQLARLDRGEPLATEVPLTVTVWTFGDELSMVFLAGEVVIDYALRLRQELPNQRLWISAYTNDVPCYIASRRVLAEGGYEADSSMYFYDRPTRLAPEVEDIIIAGVKKLLPAEK